MSGPWMNAKDIFRWLLLQRKCFQLSRNDTRTFNFSATLVLKKKDTRQLFQYHSKKGRKSSAHEIGAVLIYLKKLYLFIYFAGKVAEHCLVFQTMSTQIIFYTFSTFDTIIEGHCNILNVILKKYWSNGALVNISFQLQSSERGF